VDEGEKRLAGILSAHPFAGRPLVATLDLDPANPVKSYMDQTPSTDAGDRYNGPGYWSLPMPVSRGIDHRPGDVVFYDGEGYPKVRDYLKTRGVRHVLLLGYATDMCVISTTCGYENLSRDFNLFLVGDATMATFPGSATPRFATQVAVANAALRQMITQVGWVRLQPR
jgi:nicotinamidase-related amidase